MGKLWPLSSILWLLVLAYGCADKGPTAPTATAPVSDFRYEHVVSPPISNDTHVTLQLWYCDAGPRDGPAECPLVAESTNVFRCTDQQFLDGLAHLRVDCRITDYRIDVTIRTSSYEWIMQTAHDIYLNNTKVTRIAYPTIPPFPSYPWETGHFRIDARGQIY